MSEGSRPGLEALPEGLRLYLRPVEFAPGEVLLRQGEPVRVLYLIISGTVSIHLGSATGARRVAQLGAGAWLGELALLTGGVSSTTVIAQTAVEAVCAMQGEFLAAAEADPNIFRSLAEVLAQRLRSADRLLDQPATSRIVLLWHERRQTPVVGQILAECSRWSPTPVLALSNSDLGGGISAVEYAASPSRLSSLERRAAGGGTVTVPIGDPGSPALSDFLRLAAPFAPLIVVAVSQPISPVVMPRVTDTVSLVPGARTMVSSHDAEVPHHAWRVGADVDPGRIARWICHQRIGLALGGGASRGYAHLGVIKALTEAGVSVDVVTGTSIGAVVGASISSGMELDEIAADIESSAHGAMVPQLIPAHSLFTNLFLESSLKRRFGDRRFEDLALPLGITAVDLETAEELVFTSGPLVLPLLASISLPGIFPPVRHGGRLLVDGGLRIPLPVAACRELGADIVVASRLTVEAGRSEHIQGPRALPWLADTFSYALDIMQDGVSLEASSLADVCIETVIPRRFAGLFDFGHRSVVESMGERASWEAMPQIYDRISGLRRLPLARAWPRAA